MNRKRCPQCRKKERVMVRVDTIHRKEQAMCYDCAVKFWIKTVARKS